MSAALALAPRALNTDTEWIPENEPMVRADREAFGLVSDLADDPVPEAGQWLGARGAGQPLDANTFRRLSDLLLLPPSMLHPQERAFATDLLHAALTDVDADIRGQLAARLARMGEIAPSLIARLVRDEDIAVATPLLRLSEGVAEADLIEILRSGCQERALIIAGRSVLSSDAVAEIAIQGDNKVLLRALGNRGAQFDSITMAKLSKRVRDDAVLCESLLQRPEMSPRCALDLFWSLNRKLRGYVLGRFLEDGQVVRQILDSRSSQAGLPRSEADGTTRKTGAQDCLDTVAELMTKAKGQDAARLLARLTSVSVPTASNIVADSGGDAIAVAFKAAGASRATFANACALWLKADAAPLTDDADVDEIGEQFDRLSRGQARMAMSYWNWRENKLGPYAPNPQVGNRDFA